MYTELKLKAKLKRNKELEDVLIKEEIEWEKEWRCPLMWRSAYFDNNDVYPSLEVFYNYSIFKWEWNIKNYKYEIEELLEKIKPFVIEWEWSIHYEEYENPNQLLIMEDWKPIIKDTDEEIFI